MMLKVKTCSGTKTHHLDETIVAKTREPGFKKVKSANFSLHFSSLCRRHFFHLQTILHNMQQVTGAVLEMEDERAIWSTTQKASMEGNESKSKSYSAEIALLKKYNIRGEE